MANLFGRNRPPGQIGHDVMKCPGKLLDRGPREKSSDAIDLRSRPRRLARRLGLGAAAELLRRQGHVVFAPTLTGQGERTHHISPRVNATMHIADIVNLIRYERLRDIVLVGHSYGGNVISGVAEIVPDKIAALVFLDAFVPDDGDAVVDLVQPVVKEAILAAAARGETTVPVRDAAAFNVNEKDRAWVDSLAGPQPIGTMTENSRYRRPRQDRQQNLHPRLRLSERRIRSRACARQGRGLAHLRSAVRAQCDDR